MNETNKSEVARLREQIRLEYEASKRALIDLSIIAPHQFITKRMERIELLRKELILEAGETKGMLIFVEVSEQFAPDAGGPHASI
jgi:hypothetical protein